MAPNIPSASSSSATDSKEPSWATTAYQLSRYINEINNRLSVFVERIDDIQQVQAAQLEALTQTVNSNKSQSNFLDLSKIGIQLDVVDPALQYIADKILDVIAELQKQVNRYEETQQKYFALQSAAHDSPFNPKDKGKQAAFPDLPSKTHSNLSKIMRPSGLSDIEAIFNQLDVLDKRLTTNEEDLCKLQTRIAKTEPQTEQQAAMLNYLATGIGKKLNEIETNMLPVLKERVEKIESQKQREINELTLEKTVLAERVTRIEKLLNLPPILTRRNSW